MSEVSVEAESGVCQPEDRQGVDGGDGRDNEDGGNVQKCFDGVQKDDVRVDDRDSQRVNEDPDSDAKQRSVMAEDSPRGTAAEIPVTSNGDAEDGHDDVFQRDPSQVMPRTLNMPETRLSPVSYSPSVEEGIIEAGPYKSALRPQPTSGPVVLTDDLRNPAMEKLDLVRKWSINTYKCTRQILSEKLGRGSRTVDLELEAQIDVLRDNKRKYEHVVKLAQTLFTQLGLMIQTQRQLGDAFADLSLKSPELHEEFAFNADTQKLLSKNGDTLLGAINFFIASVKTLVDKTIEDTMVNIKQYETARVEYDAYRTDLEELNMGPRDANTMPRIEQSQQQFQLHREKYEKMRQDVVIKLKFLEENKVKVLHNQLLLFHNAIAAYYAGNQQQLEQTLKQFHIKLKLPGGDSPSWLEEN
nr:arfaptin-1 isoform X3 [Paramormyrops kingsleyae]